MSDPACSQMRTPQHVSSVFSTVSIARAVTLWPPDALHVMQAHQQAVSSSLSVGHKLSRRSHRAQHSMMRRVGHVSTAVDKLVYDVALPNGVKVVSNGRRLFCWRVLGKLRSQNEAEPHTLDLASACCALKSMLCLDQCLPCCRHPALRSAMLWLWARLCECVCVCCRSRSVFRGSLRCALLSARCIAAARTQA